MMAFLAFYLLLQVLLVLFVWFYVRERGAPEVPPVDRHESPALDCRHDQWDYILHGRRCVCGVDMIYGSRGCDQ